MPLRRQDKTIIGLVIAVLVVMMAGAWLALDWSDPFDDQSFSRVAWAEDLYPEARARMARDLVKNHLPNGASRYEVVRLLGTPGGVSSGVDGGGNVLPGTETYMYYIGSWSMHGMDDAFVYVHFDRTGVIGSAIVGY